MVKRSRKRFYDFTTLPFIYLFIYFDEEKENEMFDHQTLPEAQRTQDIESAT